MTRCLNSKDEVRYKKKLNLKITPNLCRCIRQYRLLNITIIFTKQYYDSQIPGG